MLCSKISENPRKGFLQLLARGMNKIKKRIYFRTLRHSSFLLPPVMECFTEKGAFWYTLMYIVQCYRNSSVLRYPGVGVCQDDLSGVKATF